MLSTQGVFRLPALLTAAALLTSCLPGFIGCGSSASSPSQAGTPTKNVAAESGTGESLSPDALRTELDEVLVDTLRHRSLNLKEHAAWQILHGALAYQREFLVVNEAGEKVPAVDHVLAGGYMKGFNLEPGVWLDKEQTRRGVRAILEQGSKTGQGHADQWFAILAQCGLQPTDRIVIHGENFTMQELIEQVLWDVPRSPIKEYSWTVIGLSTYLPSDYEWTASDEQTWSIEKLMGIEAEQDIDTSACGGTHRLIGMTMALNRHLQQGGKLEGGWQKADEKIQHAIKTAKAYQNADGSFSANYFIRGGLSADLAQNLGASGHQLEFLTLALSEEELQQPWMQRAVLNMCSVLRRTRDFPLECGALYHAVHGLVLYRQRVFGERTYGDSDSTSSPAETPPAAREARRP